MKVRIKFSKEGPMKFVGHLDTMRYFQKALRRAELPVAFSGGYSPHMIMSFAVPLGVGGMAAIIGLSEEKLKECLVEARKYGVVEISNYNTPKQLVIGGEAKAVEVAIELCKEAGARRAVPLKVSGPFHTPLLEEASVNLAKELNNIEFQDMKIPVLTNVTAEVIADSSEIKDI